MYRLDTYISNRARIIRGCRAGMSEDFLIREDHIHALVTKVPGDTSILLHIAVRCGVVYSGERRVWNQVLGDINGGIWPPLRKVAYAAAGNYTKIFFVLLKY